MNLSRRVAGAVGTIALAGGALAVVPAAGATTGSVNYACTSAATGDFTAAVEIDSAPSPVAAGQPVTFTTKLTIPGTERPDFPPTADKIAGTAALEVNGAGAKQTVQHTIPITDIPAAGPVPLLATGTWTPLQSGDYTLVADDLTASLQFYNGAAAVGSLVAVTCSEPVPAPTIDAISVTATSVTKLTVNNTRAKFGEDVLAKAEVGTTGGGAAGSLVFTLGSETETVAVAGNGRAQTTLTAGQPPGSKYPLTATFVPTDAKNVTGSTASTDVKISKDKTNAQVRAGSSKRGKKVQVKVSINSVHGEKVDGKVKVILKRGSTKLRVETRSLRNEERTIGLIRLYDTGRYKVRVKYLGSPEFRKTSDKDQFFVFRR